MCVFGEEPLCSVWKPWTRFTFSSSGLALRRVGGAVEELRSRPPAVQVFPVFPGRCEQSCESCARRLQTGLAVATDGRLPPRPAAEPSGGRHREGFCLPGGEIAVALINAQGAHLKGRFTENGAQRRLLSLP